MRMMMRCPMLRNTRRRPRSLRPRPKRRRPRRWRILSSRGKGRGGLIGEFRGQGGV